MTKYDFDKIIDRRNTDCLKYDFAIQRGRPADVLPFWVADMDFPIAREIQEALVERCQHAIFGYSEITEAYFHVSEVIEDNERKLINSPLILKSGHYEMDFADLEEKIVANNVKLILLCSPHNPVGRVWTRAELQKVGDICLKHGVITVSDEIHGDFVWGNNSQTVFASLGEQYEQNCVICTAPSKTFNIAGLQVSNIFIPNNNLRRRFRKQVAAAGYSQVNTLGLVACQAAYNYG